MLRSVIVASILLSGVVQAQELYGAPPPPNSAFLRVVYAGAAVGAVAVADQQVEVSGSSASDYVVVPAGSVSVAGGDVTLEAQKFYTLVLLEGGAQVLMADLAEVNKAKAVLEFFNFTDNEVDLVVAPGGPVVFEDVAPESSAARDVNPSKVAFELVGASGTVGTSAEVTLDRGSVYSIMAIPAGDTTEIAVVKNAVSQN